MLFFQVNRWNEDGLSAVARVLAAMRDRSASLDQPGKKKSIRFGKKEEEDISSEVHQQEKSPQAQKLLDLEVRMAADSARLWEEEKNPYQLGFLLGLLGKEGGAERLMPSLTERLSSPLLTRLVLDKTADPAFKDMKADVGRLAAALFAGCADRAAKAAFTEAATGMEDPAWLRTLLSALCEGKSTAEDPAVKEWLAGEALGKRMVTVAKVVGAGRQEEEDPRTSISWTAGPVVGTSPENSAFLQ